jgi:TPP-dependent pyruvate/acetoin dehydrogenase alpha subunit
MKQQNNDLKLRIRNFEKKLQSNMKNIYCPTHLSLGHEDVAVELAEVMERNDWLFSTHRNHHHFLAKGGSEESLWDEIHGLQTGLNKGFAGSQAITDKNINFHSSAILGGLIGTAAGAAYAEKLNNTSNIVICCIGDAATEQGVFWETLNFVRLYMLPICFIVENNEKSVDAHISERQAIDIVTRVNSFGIKIKDTVSSAVTSCRLNKEPTFHEAKVKIECAHLNMATMLDLCDQKEPIGE